MKRFFFILISFYFFSANAQVGWNLTLLSKFHDPNLATIGTQIWNGCKGWADTAKHHEYAIAGSIDSIYFFDISNPNVIKKVAVQYGLNRAINRDFAVFDHFVYCVSDNIQSGFGALQIFDMQYLPDSVHKVYESDSTGAACHTVFVDLQTKRLYKCINRYKLFNLVTCLEVYSLQNPISPAFLFRLDRSTNYDVHECYVRNNILYASEGFQGLFFYNVSDIIHPKTTGSIVPPYPENAYNHSCWLDSSGKYILFTDETKDGTGIKIYDITDPANAKMVGSPFRDYGSPHNAYWVGRFAYVSMYYGGVNIYDLADVTKPKLVAFYKTFNQTHDPNSFEGCWGVYPFLPSGNIIASDMNTGIYLLKPALNLSASTSTNNLTEINIYPNPFSGIFKINYAVVEKQVAHLLVCDAGGKIAVDKMINLNTGENEISINEMENFSNGIYFLKIVSAKNVFHQLIIKK